MEKTGNIICIKELLRERRKSSPTASYTDLIGHLEDIRINSNFYQYTKQVLQQYIDWLKLERDKPPQERLDEIVIVQRWQTVQEAMEQDILKAQLPLLQMSFKILKLTRAALDARLEYLKVFPAKKNETKLRERIIQLTQTRHELQQHIIQIEPFVSKPVKKICHEFLQWLKTNADADKHDYALWQKRLLCAITAEISSEYFTWWERVKLKIGYGAISKKMDERIS